MTATDSTGSLGISAVLIVFVVLSTYSRFAFLISKNILSKNFYVNNFLKDLSALEHLLKIWDIFSSFSREVTREYIMIRSKIVRLEFTTGWSNTNNDRLLQVSSSNGTLSRWIRIGLGRVLLRILTKRNTPDSLKSMSSFILSRIKESSAFNC